jgi:CHAT domain-containing protein
LQRINALVEQLRIADTTRRAPAPTDRAADQPPAALESALATARASYDSLLDRMNQSASRGAIVGASTVDVPSIQRSLAPGERVVEYFTAEDRLLIFVVSRRRVQCVGVPVSNIAIAEQARLARDLIAARNTNASGPLTALYANLIRPLEQRELLDGADRLIIVPHEALTYLPFAALRASDAAPYLAERFSIVMLTSASALVPLRRAPLAATRGNEVFAPLTKELPASRDEAAAVSRTLATSPTIDAGASELAVRRALHLASIVHVASHGTLDAARPMFSAIVLAPASRRNDAGPENDGRLETHEVLGLTVNSALVYLSGCETALGASGSTGDPGGEDYTTLAQAFLFAGARNVVATLWRIDDRGASEFATRFYGALAESTPATALAAAQRSLIHNPRYASPYYWAAYTVSGAGTNH